LKTKVAWCRTSRVWSVAALLLSAILVVGLFSGCSSGANPGGVRRDASLDRKIKQAEESARVDPDNTSLEVSLALLYTDAGRYGDAQTRLTKVLKENPDHQGALAALGSLYVQQGKYREAVEPLKKVADANIGNPMAGLSRALESVYYLLGKAYLGLGSLEEAVASLKAALDIDYTDSDVMLLLGEAYQRQGKHQDALGQLERAAEFVPDFTEVYAAMAVSYKALGQSNQELYAFGMVAFSKGSSKEAIEKLKKVVSADPRFTPAYLGLGLSYEELRMTGDALAAYRKALELDPESFLARQKVSFLEGK
jgi:tetratricopeptide (TPR) repeat protein